MPAVDSRRKANPLWDWHAWSREKRKEKVHQKSNRLALFPSNRCDDEHEQPRLQNGKSSEGCGAKSGHSVLGSSVRMCRHFDHRHRDGCPTAEKTDGRRETDLGTAFKPAIILI